MGFVEFVVLFHLVSLNAMVMYSTKILLWAFYEMLLRCSHNYCTSKMGVKVYLDVLVFKRRGVEMALLLMTMLVLLNCFSSVEAQSITGTVFRDFNANGVKDNSAAFNEVGVGGVTVKCVGVTGTGTTTTSTTFATLGQFTLTGCTGATRVEFTWSTAADYSGVIGSANNSSVQFINATRTNIDFGINYPSDYCQNAPTVVIPMYVSGDPLATGSNGGTDNVFISFPYSASGRYENFCQTNCNLSGTPNIPISQAKDVGSLWGLAYARTSKKLFSAAVLKRHVGLGPNGLGAVYVTDMTTPSSPPTPTLFYNFGASAGTIASNSGRGLPADKTVNSVDVDAFSKAAKVGLGDIDISDDETKLYVVNLSDRKVYSLVTTGTTASTATALPDFPNPNCNNGVARPWGLKYYKDKLYLGVVCTGENGGTYSDLDGFIYEFNIATNSWNTNAVLTIDLSYPKGLVRQGQPAGDKWNPWTDDFHNFIEQGGCNFCSFYHPQPLISDIEFDEDGSMHIGLLDRSGFQTGHRNSLPDNSNLANGQSSGDILRTYKNPITGVFTLEENGSAGPYTSAGTGTGNEGPGGVNSTQGPSTSNPGEFYWDDQIQNGFHSEVSFGGLAMRVGSKEIFNTSMDPVTLDAGGVKVYDITNGNTIRNYQTYFGDAVDEGTPGKANGVGDIELLCNPAPIEIGNRVWLDTDSDGVQDAGEAGIAGVQVQLLKGSTVIGTATTDPNGNYLFSSATGTSTASAIYGITQLLPNMAYTVHFPTTANVSATTYNLTTANSSTGTDLIDSDASITGDISILATDIPVSGANNHTFDVGYSSTPCVINTPTVTPMCNNNGTASDPSDDTFTFTINTTGTGVGTTYKVDKTAPTPTSTPFASVNYGTTSAASPSFPISGGNLSLSLTDNTTTSCTLANVNVPAPTPCSTPIVTGQPDLELTKMADKSSVVSGNTLVYTLTLRNIGTASATGVKVKDLIPAGLTYVSSVPSQGTYTSGTGIWDVGTVTIGATLTLTITVTVN
jgi:uncharacterized repeat protein (TIGR01451 family)